MLECTLCQAWAISLATTQSDNLVKSLCGPVAQLDRGRRGDPPEQVRDVSQSFSVPFLDLQSPSADAEKDDTLRVFFLRAPVAQLDRGRRGDPPEQVRDVSQSFSVPFLDPPVAFRRCREG